MGQGAGMPRDWHRGTEISLGIVPMNAFEGLAYGFSVALAPHNLLAAVAGALIGTLVGVLPGIGPLGAMALLLTATLSLRPETAVIMLSGIYYGAMYGGSTTSVLVNVPGEAASVVTTIDGYQMARRGRAGAALTVAAVGSFVAGTLGVVGLMLFAPALSQLALTFGPPEYFAIALLGLVALSRVSGGSVWRGLLVLAFGLALATVGMDLLSAAPRYTFGVLELSQGVELVPVAMGLFGVAEVLSVAEQAGGLPQTAGVKLRELLPTRKEWDRALPAMLRATGLGFLLGLIPGPANVLSTFVSYGLERRLSRNPGEFGRGAIEGVAGPESANNAATSAQMVPLLALGLPFSASTAVLLAALMIQGVQPGPLLMKEHPDIFWGVVASMYIGNVALLVLNLPLVGMWVAVLRLPQPLLLSVIMVFILVGCYSLNNSLLDLLVVSGTGGLGYLLKKLKFDLAPLILAVVLGPTIEKTFRQSLFMSSGDPAIFVQRPISLAVLVILLAILVVPALLRPGRARGHASVDARLPSGFDR